MKPVSVTMHGIEAGKMPYVKCVYEIEPGDDVMKWLAEQYSLHNGRISLAYKHVDCLEVWNW